MKQWFDLFSLQNYFVIIKFKVLLLCYHIVRNELVNPLVKWTMIQLMIKKIIRVKIPLIQLLCLSISPNNHTRWFLSHQPIYLVTQGNTYWCGMPLRLMITLRAQVHLLLRVKCFNLLKETRMRSCDQDWSRTGSNEGWIIHFGGSFLNWASSSFQKKFWFDCIWVKPVWTSNASITRFTFFNWLLLVVWWRDFD